MAQYVLSSVEVHFNDTFCRVLCGKSSMSTKWYFDVAVLTLGANIYRKLPFLIFTKSVFLKYKINFLKKKSSTMKCCGLSANYEKERGYLNIKNCVVTLVQQPLFFLKGNNIAKAIGCHSLFWSQLKNKNRGDFCFAALFKSGLFFERNTRAEMGKGKTLPGQSLIRSIKTTFAFGYLV